MCYHQSMSGKGWMIGVLILIAALLFAGYFFYAKTGGNGLTRVVWHYFIRDLPDKKYDWRDFTDRGVDQGISGFYAYGDEGGFSMWTLSGLKTFAHVPGTSVYRHEDICFAVRQMSDNPEENKGPVKADVTITGKISVWMPLMKKEYLVTVLRTEGSENHNGVDKVWSYSGIYKQLNKLDGESCR